MPKSSDQKSLRQAPLYIRWAPFRSSYAIEFRLELVSQLLAEIERAAAAGLEVGGALIGSFPNAQMPTIRIEEVELMARMPENGAFYVPHPETHRHLSETRSDAQRRGRAVTGFFRSHARSSPLLPSLTDRTLFSEEFAQGIFALLLIEARAPHFGNFFIAGGGRLPEEPSTREFRLDEEEFKALPEIRPAAPAARRPAAREASKIPLYGVLTIALIAVIALFSWFVPRGIPGLWPGQSQDQIGLAVTAPSDHLVRINWDHSARAVSAAKSGTLLIVDGANRREIKIGPDELRLGTVEYERTAPQVAVTMTLDAPGMPVPAQSARWTQR